MVELYLEGHSAADLVKRFELNNRRRVSGWAKQVRVAGTFEVLHDTRGLANKGKTKLFKETLKEENERLTLEVLYLKKLIALKGRCAFMMETSNLFKPIKNTTR